MAKLIIENRQASSSQHHGTSLNEVDHRKRPRIGVFNSKRTGRMFSEALPGRPRHVIYRMVNKGTIRVVIEVIHLKSELVRIRPVIIPFEECDVLPATFFESVDRVAAGAQILFPE